jgi:hypothetical protein
VKLPTWLRHILTGPDDKTEDLSLILTFVGVLLFLVNSTGALWVRGQDWDPSAYGTGLSLVLAAGALSSRATRWTQTKEPPE